MADAQNTEFKSYNLHSAGSDYNDGTALLVKSSSGAITIDGVAVGSVNALYVTDPVAHDAADAGNPLKIGARARTSAITAVANNDRVDLIATAYGALNVHMVDASGVTASIGGGTQYVEDAALGAVGSATGTLAMGRAAAAAPTAVGADADAVAAWYLRSGQQVVSLAAGTALIGGDATGGLHVQGAIAHDGVDSGSPIKVGGKASTGTPTAVANADRVDAWFHSRGQLAVFPVASDGTEVITNTGTSGQYVQRAGLYVHNTGPGWQALGSISPTADAVTASALSLPSVGYGYASNGTNWDRIRTAPGVTGFLGIGGPTAGDAAIAAAPVTTGGRASTAVPTPVSADGDVVNGWLTRTGATVVDGGVAHDAADAGSPIKMGGRARTSAITAVANDDRVDAVFTAYGAQTVSLVDAAGAAITTGAQYVEDAALPANAAQGTVVLARRDDSLSALTPADGDAVSLRVNSIGQLHTIATITDPVDINSFGGTLPVEGDVAHDLADAGNPVKIGGRARTSAIAAVANNDRVDGVFTAYGALNVHMVDASGVTASLGGGTQYVEDVALGAVGSATGTLIMGRSSAAAPTAVSADADAVAAWYLRSGQQVVSLAAGTALLGGDATGGLHVQGAIAHDGVDSGNPIKIGGKAANLGSLPTAVAPADRVNATFNTVGGLLTQLMGATASTASPRYLVTPDVDALNGDYVLASGLVGYNGSTGWDRLRTIEAFVAAAANPHVGLGATSLADRRFSSVNIATTGSTTLMTDTGGSNHALIRLGTSQTGAFNFEVTADGSNWTTAEVFKGNGDLWVSGMALTPASGDVYRVLTSGYRALRATVTSTLGGTVAAVGTLVQTPVMSTAHNTGPMPHALGYTPVTKTAQYTTTQTGVALWTPASGRKIVVTQYQIGVGGTTAGTMQLWFGASGDTTYSRATDKAVFDHEFAPSATLKPGVVQTGVWQGAIDDILRVTDSAAINPLTVTVWGYETV